jgi:hypothetical protein
MSTDCRLRKLLTLLFLLSPVILSACAATKTLLGDGGGAEVYPGGDPIRVQFVGTYYYVTPAERCGYQMTSYRYQVKIYDADHVQLYGTECSSRPEGLSLDWSAMAFTPYNQDYFLKANQVFTKRESAPQITDAPDIPELFCRYFNKTDLTGADVVVLRNGNSTRRVGRIYAGAKIDGMYSTFSTEEFPVSFTPDPVNIGTYTGNGFDLALDKSITFSNGTMFGGHLKTDLLEKAYSGVTSSVFKCSYLPLLAP